MQNHILYQLRFEVNASSEMDKKQLQQDISKLTKGRLLEIIESIFDEIGLKKNIRIPKLELEIDAVTSENWEEIFIQKLSKQLYLEIDKWEINNLKEKNNGTNLSIPEEDSLFYFLENGTLPWHNNSLTINELKKHFVSNMQSKSFQSTILDLLFSNEKALKRFIFQFDSKESFQILNILFKDTPSQVLFFETLEKFFARYWNKKIVRFQIWKSLLKYHFERKLKFNALQFEVTKQIFSFFSNQKKSKHQTKDFENTLLNGLKEIFPSIHLQMSSSNDHSQSKSSRNKNNLNLDNKTKTSKNVQKNQIENLSKKSSPINISNQEGFYIDNAGLIILHPFFQYLFDELEFTNQNKFVDIFQQNQAALALHYLVSGNEIAFEPDLIFNKILCNIPIQEPIQNQFILNERSKTECNNLLNATIQHWSALKSTSIEGLRNTFLQREGKISQKDNGDWLLQVQSSGVDVLLSKLPWGIGIVNLPWMDENIFVEWQ